MTRSLVLAVLVGLACASEPSPRPPSLPDWLPEDAHAGIENTELRRLLDEHWAWTLETYPFFATSIGVRQLDDRMADGSHAAVLDARQKLKQFAARARRIQRDTLLTGLDASSSEILASGIENQLATAPCEFHLWSVDPHIGNALNAFNELAVFHTVQSEQDGRNLVDRYRAIPRALAQRSDNLRRGLKRGYVANAVAVRLMAEAIEQDLAEPGSPLLAPAEVARPDWSPGARDDFVAQLREAVETDVEPAFDAYARFLREEILPHARGLENEGVVGVPNGKDCYAARVREQTTLPLATADELHQIGLNEISWINAEMLEIGEAELGEVAVAALMSRLRVDPDLQFSTEQEIVEKSEAALAQARAAIPAYFGTLPKTPCEVLPVPAYRAPATPAGYYTMTGAADDRTGRFYVNTHLPETRPRFGLETLTYHESIPGHHLQIALSQELGEMPAFRKYSVSVAFSEGWGLYAERFAADMGLYSGPLDRIGQLNAEAWRAARLVVDTGVHARGWTRQEALEFMLGHTALPKHDIETEVGRYIANPGQALAYKAGQLEILRLRSEAEQRLGGRFDVRGFHDAVLLGGAVPLPMLQRQVDVWVESQGP